MHLHKKGHRYIGWYYYNTEERPIGIYGDDTTKRDAIILRAYPDDAGEDDAEQFEISQVGESFAGTWQLNDKSTPLIVNAETVADTSLSNFQFIYTYGSKKLKPAMKESPEASFEEATIWPADSTPAGDSIKKILYGDSSIKKAGVGDMLLKNKQNYLGAYGNDMLLTDTGTINKFLSSYSRDVSNVNTVAYQSQKLLTIARYSYQYDGGAHGMYGTGYTSINRITNKVLALDEVLTVKGKAMLPGLLEKHFRTDHKLAPTAPLTEGNLFKNKIEPNKDNFFVTGKGIGFYYFSYEIGPYSMGQITIFIPFSEFTAELQNGFKQLLQ